MFSTEISISPMVYCAVPNPSREGRERRNQYDLEVLETKKLISCEFNIDTACVELRYTDGMMISIDCTEVEYEVAHTIRQRAALDYAFSISSIILAFTKIVDIDACSMLSCSFFIRFVLSFRRPSIRKAFMESVCVALFSCSHSQISRSVLRLRLKR